MPTLYTKKWTDKNGTVRYYKDEEARQDIATLNGNASVSGSVDNKIATALANLGGFLVVPSLESVTDPDIHIIYLVKDSSVLLEDKYKEYIYIADDVNDFVMIGDTSIDLSNYVQKTDYATSSVGGTVKIDGTNMSINNGVITALTVNGHTVATDVPANAVFTDTTDLTQMTGTLPLTNGGTGATDASGARTNLGLGTAATAATTNSITSGGTGLPTSGTVYSYTAPVVITSSSASAPSDTRALWVFPSN